MHIINIENTLYTLAIITLVAIISFSTCTFPSSDDFSLYHDLSHTSVLQHAERAYINWDGRAISIPVLVQLSMLKYCSAQVSIFVWSLTFVLNALLIVKMLVLECTIKIDTHKQMVIFWGFTASILWLGFHSHISQTVYWATGGVYSLASSIALFWMYQFLKMLKLTRSLQVMEYSYIFVVSIVAGTLSQNLALALFVFIAISYLTAAIRINKALYIVVLTGLFIGVLVLLVAPGNFNRASLGPNTKLLISWQMIYHACYALAYYGWKSVLLVILSLILALVVMPQPLSERYGQVGNTASTPSKIVRFLTTYKWLIVALSTVLVFAVVPDFVSSRTSIYFMFFLVLFIVTFINNNTINILLYSVIVRFATDNAKQKIILSVFICFIGIISSHYYRAIDINTELHERTTQLLDSSNRDQTVCLKPLQASIPFSLRFDDIVVDSSFWINNAVAQYYGLRSVVLCK